MKEMIEPELLTMLEQNTQVGKWKRYEEYKDSDIEYLGKIPAHWKIARLGYLSKVIDPQPDHRAPALAQGDGFPYVGIRDLNADGSINVETARKVEEDALVKQEKSFQINPGDIVFCKVGTLGYPRHIKPSGRLALSATLVLIKCNPLAFTEYLKYALDSTAIYAQIENMSTGSTRAALGIEQIRKFILCYLPLLEQQAIVTFLDRETTKINDLIAKRERMIALLQEQRTAIINRAITKGLRPDVPLKDSGVEWLGEIPAHWEVRKLKYIANFSGGGTPPKAIEEYWTGNIPWVSPKDMKSEIILDTEDHISEEAIENSTTNLVPSNTVLLVVRSGILRHSIPVALTSRPVTINQDIKAIITKNMLLPRYLVSLIQSHQEILLMEWRKSGATVESIEHELLINTPIPIPPLEEQKQALAFIERKVVPISKLISVIEEAIKKLKEYNTALISAAVTGKIDVRGEVAAMHTEEAAL